MRTELDVLRVLHGVIKFLNERTEPMSTMECQMLASFAAAQIINVEEAQTVSRGTVPEKKPEDIVTPESPFDGLSDDEILYFATPYYDELQEKKQQQIQKQGLEEDTHD